MPVAEAMIAGCPVACANTTSLPEIAGDAAVTFDPLDAAAMADAMLRLGRDADVARGVRGGRFAAARALFSARNSALKTLGVYRRVFEEFHAV